MIATKEHAEQIAKLSLQGLSKGLGSPVPGFMCVEALVCYVLAPDEGLHDRPECVAYNISGLKISLNDLPWSDNVSRGRGLQKLAIAQLNSKDNVDEVECFRHFAINCVSRYLPAVIDAYIEAQCKDGGQDDLRLVLNRVRGVCANVLNGSVGLNGINFAYLEIQKEINNYERAVSLENYSIFYSGFLNSIKQIASYAKEIHNPPPRHAFLPGSTLHRAINTDQAEFAWDKADDIIRHTESFVDEDDSGKLLLADIFLQALIHVKSPGCQWLYLADA